MEWDMYAILPSWIERSKNPFMLDHANQPRLSFHSVDDFSFTPRHLRWSLLNVSNAKWCHDEDVSFLHRDSAPYNIIIEPSRKAWGLKALRKVLQIWHKIECRKGEQCEVRTTPRICDSSGKVKNQHLCFDLWLSFSFGPFWNCRKMEMKCRTKFAPWPTPSLTLHR